MPCSGIHLGIVAVHIIPTCLLFEATLCLYGVSKSPAMTVISAVHEIIRHECFFDLVTALKSGKTDVSWKGT